MDSEWKEGDVCLAPSYQTDGYVISEVNDILQNVSNEFVAAITERGASLNKQEFIDVSLLLEVPHERQKPEAWKRDDLCLVRVDRNNFRLATIIHAGADVAVVKFLNVFTKQISEEEPVSNSCLYKVVKKRKPEQKYETIPETRPKNKKSLKKRIVFGLVGAIGLAVLTPIVIPIAIGAL